MFISTNQAPSIYLLKDEDDVQSLRKKHECVMVCMSFVAEHDPSLMVEDEKFDVRMQPLRVVLGKLNQLNFNWKILSDNFKRNTMIVVTDEDLRSHPEIVQHLEARGVSLFSTKANLEGSIDLRSVLRTLGSLKLKSILVEDHLNLRNQLLNMGL